MVERTGKDYASAGWVGAGSRRWLDRPGEQTSRYILYGYALSKHLVHFEHANPVNAEDILHFFIADDFAFVRRILQVLPLDVNPYMFDSLRT